MKRGVKEADGYRVSFHGLIQFHKVAFLKGKNLCKSFFSLFFCIGTNHFTEAVDSVAFKEHMLCTAKSDSLCAELSCFSRVGGRVGVGSDLQCPVFIGPCHNSSKFAGNGCVHGLDCAVVHIACGTVKGNHISFMVFFSGKGKFPVLFVHGDCGAS